MNTPWSWLAWTIAATVFLAACGGAQQEAAPEAEEAVAAVEQEVPPPPEMPGFEGLPQPDLAEPGEYDVDPSMEGPEVSAPPPVMIDPSQLPPPRAQQGGAPPSDGEPVAEADDSGIYDKARQYEEELARIAAPPQPMEAELQFEVVYFDFDKSNIKPEFEAVIQRNADKLIADRNLYVMVEGHCDERGTTEYNLALGERRARAVQQALISLGVSPNQLDTVSYGEERPVAMGHNEEAWAQNRRSVLTVR